MTVGGDRINYLGDVATKTADITTTKLLLNSVVSTPNAKFMTLDVKNFYLNTPLKRYEYLRIPINLIPEEVIQQYQLHLITHNGHVYVEIRKGMYGLPQAGLLANQLLESRLALDGYYQATHTPGLWKNHTKPVQFTLVVDDFGVEYVGITHAHHLIETLQKYYEITMNWKGELYCGISSLWDYDNRTVDLDMPTYIDKLRTRFQHKTPAKPQHSPY